MNSLWARYLAGDPALAPLLPWPWPEVPWEAVRQARATYPIDRATLVQALLQQNAPFLSTDPTLEASILALREESTFTVTTGQQLGWLTGPLYTIVKALHALQLSQTLHHLWGGKIRVVPVFWLASEDHDAEEVREVALSWSRRLRYEGTFAGPVGRHRIEAAFPPEAYDLALQPFWKEGQTWEGAFRAAMQHLFHGTGLIWLSGDDPTLKALATPLWLQEIQAKLTTASHALSASFLKKEKMRPRLAPRPINLFWLSDAERRYPTLSEESELLRIAHQQPERLSPNVLLRPLYQEYLLPNLAYVAGPAEVAYWIELTPVFQAFGVPMPVVYPRGHLRILPSEPPSLPSGLSWKDIWNLPQSRLRTLLAELWGQSHLEKAQSWASRYRPPWEELRGAPFLAQAAKYLRYSWQRWETTLRRAALRAAYREYYQAIQAVLTYRQQTEPEGQLQERTLNLHAFAPQHPQKWVQSLRKETRFEPGQWAYWHLSPTSDLP